MSFRNSNCMTVCVDYVEMLTVQCVANTLLLALEQVFGRIKSFKCVDLHLCCQESFCMDILYPHRKLLLYHSKKKTQWFSALVSNSV